MTIRFALSGPTRQAKTFPIRKPDRPPKKGKPGVNPSLPKGLSQSSFIRVCADLPLRGLLGIGLASRRILLIFERFKVNFIT